MNDDERLAAILRALRSYPYIDLRTWGDESDLWYLELALRVADSLDGKPVESSSMRAPHLDDDIARILEAFPRLEALAASAVGSSRTTDATKRTGETNTALGLHTEATED